MAKFEQDLEELERVVEQLERGDLPLEQSVDLFERGVVLSRACKETLSKLDARVQKLVSPETGATADVDVEEEDDDAYEEDEEV